VADLSIDFCGIQSPNPFWVGSGPPANTAHQAHRAFEAGWGGVVWKTIGDPIINVASRYSAMHLPGNRMAGFNNIELISDRAPDPGFDLPISGIGGISNWRDATEFLLVGATSLQVCTAVMHYGFRIVEEMKEGLSDYLDSKGFTSLNDIIGKSVDSIGHWQHLNLNYRRVARIDTDKCIGCNLCYVACEDGAHQCIDLVDPAPFGLGPGRVPGKPIPKVREPDCVGCNLCSLVCPVDDCIRMVPVDDGKAPLTWSQYQEKLGTGEMDPIPAHP